MAHHRIKNLLFVLPGLDTGGSEHVVFDIARGLPKNKYRPVVFSILKGPLENSLKSAGIETFVSKKSKGKGHIRLLLDISKIIRTHKIDVVLPHHFVSLFYSFWGAKIHRGTKLFFTEHAAMEIAALSLRFRVLSILFLSMSTGCIAISRQIAKAYETTFKVRPSKIFQIPNGIDLERFNKVIDVRKKRNALGILPGSAVVGTVANITEVKNHRNLILSFRKVADALSNVVLVIAGSGPLENEMKALSRDLGIAEKVLFLGRRSDVAEIYKVLDVYSLSSFSEGFPLSILEAMASGVPVVATDVSGINEIIQDGKNGVLVPSNDPKQLAGALIELLQDKQLRQRLSHRGFETVQSRYSYDKWMEAYDKLLSP